MNASVDRQRASEIYLDRCGYPYVLDRFRFHMTLSDALDESLREPNRRALEASVLPAELTVDRIAVFRQVFSTASSMVQAIFPLTG